MNRTRAVTPRDPRTPQTCLPPSTRSGCSGHRPAPVLPGRSRGSPPLCFPGFPGWRRLSLLPYLGHLFNQPNTWLHLSPCRGLMPCVSVCSLEAAPPALAGWACAGATLTGPFPPPAPGLCVARVWERHAERRRADHRRESRRCRGRSQHASLAT